MGRRRDESVRLRLIEAGQWRGGMCSENINIRLFYRKMKMVDKAKGYLTQGEAVLG